MKNLPLFALILVLCLYPKVFSQTASPTPLKDDDVVKISTNLIQIDVTVTDKKGNVVTDLKPEDFEIYENGKLRNISNFSFINLFSKDGLPQNPEKANKKAVPVPSQRLSPEKIRRVYALAVDDMGLSFTSIYWTKQSLKRFIDEQMQDGDMVAIIRTSGGIGALQSFTTEKRLLHAAVNKIRWIAQSRVGISSFEPIRESFSSSLGRVGKSAQGDLGESLAKKSDEARNENLAIGTLGVLNYIVRGMNELSGRKAVVLFSEGFRVMNLESSSSGLNNSFRGLEALRSLADQANRAGVVFYTADPRGVISADADASDDVSSSKDSSSALADRRNLLSESQGSLRFLAYETGGVAIINQNNLNAGLKRIINDQKGYYLVAYQPDEETFDPKKAQFNKLTVKLKRPDLKVRYRSGFFGISEEKLAECAKQSDPQIQLINALVSPFGASGIDLDVYSAFYQNERKSDFIRTLVYINPKDLSFSLNEKGLYKAEFDIITAIFDANGTAATNSINTHTLQFTKERLAALQEKGIVYDLPVPVIKKGAYQFRVALRDKATGKIGAASQFVEIPDLSKKRLTLSNLIIRNYPIAEWKKVSLDPNGIVSTTNAHLVDTVKREFKKGSVMTYFCEIYNTKTNDGQKPQLLLQTKLFRDGKMIIESEPSPIKTEESTNPQSLSVFNAITLGTDLQAGDYALQVIVYDRLAREKRQGAYQSIDFEIVD